MHAYLLVGENSQQNYQKAQEIAKGLKAQLLKYDIGKIEDVRNLNNFISLTVTQKTVIFMDSFHQATPEATNAFLKNLEEPQADLYFILTTSSMHQVLPTISSRCQIIKMPGIKKDFDYSSAKKFLLVSTPQRFALIDKIKKDTEALTFLDSCLAFIHSALIAENINSKINLTKVAKEIEETIKRIKGNGNVSIQLTKMTVNMGDIDTSNLKLIEV